MFGIFKRKPKKWREFVCYIDAFFKKEVIAVQIIQKANELGLQGKKITVLHRVNKFEVPNNGDLDQIWFEGEFK